MNQLELNKRIEALILEKDHKGISYSSNDKLFIQGYEGSGGLASQGARGEGLLHEFYTPSWLCKKMWELAMHYGYTSGTVLEPSSGTGRLIQTAPDPSEVTAFEINPIAARIAQIINPKATVLNQHFETAFLNPERFTSKYAKGITWLSGYPFSLVIANPPYGKHLNQYSGYFKSPAFKQMEFFFTYHCLRLLAPGGLLVFLTSSNIMRSGASYQKEKDLIGSMATLVDAFRLPPVFKHTSISTDIIILKKT